MKLWCVEVQHPKENARQRNIYIEQIMVLAEDAESATRRYQKHLDEIEEATPSPRSKGRAVITKTFETSTWFVSRGRWKKTEEDEDARKRP